MTTDLLPITIQPISADRSDILEFAAVQIASFDPFTAFQDVIEPPPRASLPERTRRLAARISKKVGSAQKEGSHVGYKAVREDTGEIVGIAYWMKPGFRHKKLIKEEMSEEDRDMYEGYDLVKYGNLYQAFQVKMDEVLKERGESGLWYLEILALHPAYQKQRIGTKLLDHHLALIDSADDSVVKAAPAYLESSPEGYRLYVSRGFESVGEVSAEGWEGGFPGMIRPGPVRK